MTQRTNTPNPQSISLGTVANDGTGDNLRVGGQKINENFLDLYNAVNGITNYSLPTAGTGSNGILGGVKVDGTSINITDGVISSVSGLLGRSAVSVTTTSLAVNNSATATVTGFKGYALLSIQTSSAAWVTVYSSSAAQSSDSSRTITTDPTPGSGVIAEAITASGTTQYFSPAVIGYNNDLPVTTSVYLKITNTGAASAAITVTLTMIKLEA